MLTTRSPRRLLAAYLAVVLLPLGALGWLAARLTVAEVERANARLAEVAAGGLRGVAGDIDALLAARRRAVLDALRVAPPEEATLRSLPGRLPWVRQAFWLAPNGQLRYPSPGGELGREEVAFLRRTTRLWSDARLPLHDATQTIDTAGGDRAPEGPPDQAAGWYPWHLDDGLHLLTWERQADASTLGVELDRVRLLADLVAELPDAAATLGGGGRVRLLDAEGRTLHQWGRFDPGERPAIARVALRPPLAAWSLEYFDPGTAEAARAAWLSGALPWLGGLGVLVVALAVHVYRSSRRELLEAASRVTFVNQVSHELKTPLTNVRMYAELLAEEVADHHPAAHYAGVITAESERLSRLIANVLAFARAERHELALRPRPGVPDEVVSRVLGTFAPALAARGVAVEAVLAAPASVRFDPDALEQILGNLLSNVEKYASQGGLVRVETRLLAPAEAPGPSPHVGPAEPAGAAGVDPSTAAPLPGCLQLLVADRGPGIPRAQRERIFEPFARVSNALTDGVSGTGLGLTIARELARRHGGDLVLVDGAPAGTAGTGACFVATLALDRALDGALEPTP
jgi:signal transduction histidine kinase